MEFAKNYSIYLDLIEIARNLQGIHRIYSDLSESDAALRAGAIFL